MLRNNYQFKNICKRFSLPVKLNISVKIGLANSLKKLETTSIKLQLANFIRKIRGKTGKIPLKVNVGNFGKTTQNASSTLS